jgi:peroxiredoxin
MTKRKWYWPLIVGLGLISLISLSACIKPQEKQYAPNFSLQNIDGNIVNLSDFHSKPIMLVFWRINCSACQFQIPFTQALFDKWSSDSLVVLTINVKDRAADVKDYMTSHTITYPVLLDSQGKVAQSYGIVGVPTTYFIDGNGVLAAYHIGAFQSEEDMETAIDTVFPDAALKPKTEITDGIINTPQSEIGPEVGKIAPDFTLPTANNQSISLNEFRGKTVLLNFWMSSCDACVSELKYLQTASDNLTGKQVVILTVNCGESSQAVHSVVDRLDPSFPVMLDPDGRVCTTYGRGAPTAFLINGVGIIEAIKDDAFESASEVYDMLQSIQ